MGSSAPQMHNRQIYAGGCISPVSEPLRRHADHLLMTTTFTWMGWITFAIAAALIAVAASWSVLQIFIENAGVNIPTGDVLVDFAKGIGWAFVLWLSILVWPIPTAHKKMLSASLAGEMSCRARGDAPLRAAVLGAWIAGHTSSGRTRAWLRSYPSWGVVELRWSRF